MGTYTPVIEFDKYYFRHYDGKTFAEIYEEMETMRKKVKVALDYFWDNSHFRMNDVYGKPVLTVGFYEDSISFWNFKTGDSLGTISGKQLTLVDIGHIDDMIEYVSSGLRKCCDCGEWVEAGKTYSFAGFVCDDCYNPDRHQAPDTT